MLVLTSCANPSPRSVKSLYLQEFAVLLYLMATMHCIRSMIPQKFMKGCDIILENTAKAVGECTHPNLTTALYSLHVRKVDFQCAFKWKLRYRRAAAFFILANSGSQNSLKIYLMSALPGLMYPIPFMR